MTRQVLLRWIYVTIAIYLLAIVTGVVLRYCCPDQEKTTNPIYGTYKDLIPFVIAIPALWLGFCFQRRASYVQQLRTLWSKLIDVVEDAIQYTHLPNPQQTEFGKTLAKLFSLIDEVRGVFKNIGERASLIDLPGGRGERTDDEIGLYPFEGLKDIRDRISSLGFGLSFDRSKAKLVRNDIIILWNHVRHRMLKEFDRSYPTYADSPYLIPECDWDTATNPTSPPYHAFTPRARWAVYVPLLETENAWFTIRKETQSSRLGDMAKLNPAMPSRSTAPGQRVIYVYAFDPHAGKIGLSIITDKLRALGLRGRIVFQEESIESVSTFLATYGAFAQLITNKVAATWFFLRKLFVIDYRRQWKTPVRETDIRHLAYEKWERGGKPPGDGKRFWEEAERELFTKFIAATKDVER